MTPPKTAIILAAGMSSRLRHYLGDNKPKGFLKLPGLNQTLIDRSVTKLLAYGIKQIIIGTGYGSAWYDQLAKHYDAVHCVVNPDYETTGSLATFRHIITSLSRLSQVASPILMLEADLLYNSQCFDDLISCASVSDTTLILASDYKKWGDDVFITQTNTDQLIRLDKTEKTDLVLSGITYLTPDVIDLMLAQAEKNPGWHYEDALVNITKETAILVKKTDRFIVEIDDVQHLNQAIEQLPTLEKNERSPGTRKLLLNPGPATTQDAVKWAQVVPDICPREPEFIAVMQFCRDQISQLASGPSSQSVKTIFFSGSGTAAVESMVSSVVPESGHALIVDQGSYGKRMIAMATAHQIRHTVYEPDPLKALNLVVLADYFKTGLYSHVFIVHHETSTGLLNPLESIASLCEQYNVVGCVDGMSAFGAVPVTVSETGIQFYTASSNKNLQGMAGLSFVISTQASLNNLSDYKKRTVYLDLYSEYNAVETKQQCRFTPPVQCVYALAHALKLLETEESITERYDRYKRAWQSLTLTMQHHGFNHLVDVDTHGKLITAYSKTDVPNFDFTDFHNYLYRHNITIYPGQIPGYDTFRIANIGDLSPESIDIICDKINQYLKSGKT